MPTVQSRIIGSLLGGACGDALGYPVEHKSYSTIVKIYGEKGLDHMETTDGISLITDDTQMTIYTAQGLLHAYEKGCNYLETVQEVHKSYLRWINSLVNENVVSLYENMYLKEELEKNELLEYNGIDKRMCRGGSTFAALLCGEMYSVNHPAPEGVRCGTTMRSAPIGIYCYKNPKLAFLLGQDCAALTHGHSSAYLSAGVMCMLIALLLQGEEMKPAIDQCFQHLLTQPDGLPLYTVLKRGVELSETPQEDPYMDIRELGLGWRADENLAIALYCCLRYRTNVKEALCACVNHSGDSNSVAAVCGNILGAYVGKEGLPTEFISVIQFADLLENQGDRLFHCSSVDTNGFPNKRS